MPVRRSAGPLPALALALIASACQDAPTAPTRTLTAPAGSVAGMQALACTVDVRAHTLGCTPAATSPATKGAGASAPAGLSRTLVFGQQGVYVRLNATATAPPSGDTLAVPVTVQNLLAQPLGTTDGTTYDGQGVMVFFPQAPTTSGGAGTVTILNADTTGTFTASGQQAFVYPQLLAGNQTSAVKTWLFSVPSGVTAFQFTAFVRAQMPDEATPLAAQPAHAFAGSANAGIVGGLYHSCAVRPGAGVYCWGGTGIAGAGGSMTDSTSAVPLLIPGSAGAVALAAGSSANHACWLTAAGGAACVGHDEFGQLGDGATPATPTLTARAVQMPGIASFAGLATGGQHSCALSGAGAAYCWGYDGLGQLGDGTRNSSATPVAVQTPAGIHFAQIAAGQLHSCAITTTGAAYCWGLNADGELGNGASGAGADTAAPVPVQLPGGVTLTRIAAGVAFTCGLSGSGAAYCWGDNTYGQLGDGTQTPHVTPAAVQLPAGVAFTQLVVGATHACAMGNDGNAYCWGEGTYGRLGDNLFSNHFAPTAVLASLAPGSTIVQLAAGAYHSCAIANTGTAYCWGSNDFGQIGDGTGGAGTDRGFPTPVWMP